MDMYRVTCIVQCLRALRGCTVHVILYCWIYTVYVWLGTAMGMEDEQCHIWLLHAQFLRPCLMPHMTGENGSLDMWLFLVHEYSLYFCYEFCCLHIYPVYFHHFLCSWLHVWRVHMRISDYLSVLYFLYFFISLNCPILTFVLTELMDVQRKAAASLQTNEVTHICLRLRLERKEGQWDRQLAHPLLNTKTQIRNFRWSIQ